MDFWKVFGDPIIAFFFSLTTFIISLIVGHIYYVKGKTAGAKDSEIYKQQLEKANVSLAMVQKKLNDSSAHLKDLISSSHQNAATVTWLKQVLSIMKNGENPTELEVVDTFMELLQFNRVEDAKKYADGKKSVITTTALQQFIEAMICAISNLPEKAITSFQKCANALPENLRYTAFINAGTLYHSYKANPSQAISYYKKAENLSPNDVRAVLAQVSAYLELGERESAREKMNRALRIDPDHPKTFEMLVMFHLYTGDFDKAISVGADSIRWGADPDTVNALMGDAYLAKEDFNNGLERYLLVSSKSLSFKKVLDSIILCHLELSNFHFAEKECLRYMKIFSDHQPIADKYISILSETGRDAQAIKFAESLTPYHDVAANYSVLSNLGNCYFNIGDFSKAKTCFDFSLLGYENNYTALLGLVRYWNHSPEANHNKALQILIDLEENGYGHEKDVLYNLGFTYFMLKDFTKSLEYLNESVNRYPNFNESIQLRKRVVEHSQIEYGRISSIIRHSPKNDSTSE
ncbi:tetratricopeptide repeat protein [Flavitalea antarctica]